MFVSDKLRCIRVVNLPIRQCLLNAALLRMDSFLDPFWNLDQICGWAETRDPEMVRAAALPKYGRPNKTLKISVRATHAAVGVLGQWRDVDGELWAASGWAPRLRKYLPAAATEKIARGRDSQRFALLLYNNVRAERPINLKAVALNRAWTFSSPNERAAIVSLFREYDLADARMLSDSKFSGLPVHLAATIREFIGSPEAQGPPRIFIRDLFPTLKYLEHLFRVGRLHAIGNLPKDPRAVPITVADWSGLEIGVGGDHERLGVWRVGQISIRGNGDFESVRVSKEEILKEFPIDPPKAEELEFCENDR